MVIQRHNKMSVKCLNTKTLIKTTVEKSAYTVDSLPVADIFSAWIVDFNNNKYMLKVGANAFRREGQGSWLLKHNGDDVISDMSLSE